MKIVSVEPLLIDRYLFVQIRTDAGFVGVGESGTWGHLEASAAAIANLAIQELPDHADESPDKDLLKERLRVERGFLIVPDGPGIGVELIDDVREKFPPKPRRIGTRLNLDGSVV